MHNHIVISAILFLTMNLVNAQTNCERCYEPAVYNFLGENSGFRLNRISIPVGSKHYTIDELGINTLECLRNQLKGLEEEKSLSELILTGRYIPNIKDLKLAYRGLIEQLRREHNEWDELRLSEEASKLWKEEFGVPDSTKTYEILVGNKFERFTSYDMGYRKWASFHLVVGGTSRENEVFLLVEAARNSTKQGGKGVMFYNEALSNLESSEYQTKILKNDIRGEMESFMNYFNDLGLNYADIYTRNPYSGAQDYLSMRHLYCYYGMDKTARFYELNPRCGDRNAYGEVVPFKEYSSHTRFLLDTDYTGIVTLDTKAANLIKIYNNELPYSPPRIDLPNGKSLLIFEASSYTRLFHLSLPLTEQKFQIVGHAIEIDEIIKEAAILNLVNGIIHLSTDNELKRQIGDRLGNLINSAFREYSIDEAKRSFILNEISYRFNESIEGNLITAQLIDSIILIFDAMSKYAFNN